MTVQVNPLDAPVRVAPAAHVAGVGVASMVKSSIPVGGGSTTRS